MAELVIDTLMSPFYAVQSSVEHLTNLTFGDPIVTKVDAMWAAAPIEADGEIERMAAWEIILADKELMRLLGNSSTKRGKAILRLMKKDRALDTNHNNRIDAGEFRRLADPRVTNAFKLRAKVDQMWEDVEKGPNGQVDRLTCWDFIMADGELPGILGCGDPVSGRALLRAMKEVRALDKDGSGKISPHEFQRLGNWDVVLQAKVDVLWKAMPKEADGQVERLECWARLLGDEELCRIMSGGSDPAKGRRMLEAMKAAVALDVHKDGRISGKEIVRLYDPMVREQAELRQHVDFMWAAMPGKGAGGVERLACWKVILADADLSRLVGGGKDVKKGRKMLEGMKGVKALDTNRNGFIDSEDFKRLYNAKALGRPFMR